MKTITNALTVSLNIFLLLLTHQTAITTRTLFLIFIITSLLNNSKSAVINATPVITSRLKMTQIALLVQRGIFHILMTTLTALKVVSLITGTLKKTQIKWYAL